MVVHSETIPKDIIEKLLPFVSVGEDFNEIPPLPYLTVLFDLVDDRFRLRQVSRFAPR